MSFYDSNTMADIACCVLQDYYAIQPGIKTISVRPFGGGRVLLADHRNGWPVREVIVPHPPLAVGGDMMSVVVDAMQDAIDTLLFPEEHGDSGTMIDRAIPS